MGTGGYWELAGWELLSALTKPALLSCPPNVLPQISQTLLKPLPQMPLTLSPYPLSL